MLPSTLDTPAKGFKMTTIYTTFIFTAFWAEKKLLALLFFI